MSRPLRFIPEEGALVDITCRTIQSRYLLRPDPTLKEIVLGVLGRAQRLHPVEISAFFVASNHYHLLVRVPDAERMADFMGYVQTNVARDVTDRPKFPPWDHLKIPPSSYPREEWSWTASLESRC
jgi:REP element-mobilizing transposase RayT